MANTTVIKTGPIPCSYNKLFVGDTAENATIPSDIETIDVELTYDEIEWKPHDTHGLSKIVYILTGCTVTYNGKRNIGDTGNDFVAHKGGKTLHECYGYCRVELADGRVFVMENAAYKNTKFGGATNDLAPMEGTIRSNGHLEQYASVEEFNQTESE